jgi:hypothetical protein
MERAALQTNDPALRKWNLKLAHAYLNQTAGIQLVDYAIRHFDRPDLSRGIHQLDSARHSLVPIGEGFLAYVHQRYGYKAFSRPP